MSEKTLQRYLSTNWESRRDTHSQTQGVTVHGYCTYQETGPTSFKVTPLPDKDEGEELVFWTSAEGKCSGTVNRREIRKVVFCVREVNNLKELWHYYL